MAVWTMVSNPLLSSRFTCKDELLSKGRLARVQCGFQSAGPSSGNGGQKRARLDRV